MIEDQKLGRCPFARKMVADLQKTPMTRRKFTKHCKYWSRRLAPKFLARIGQRENAERLNDLGRKVARGVWEKQ